VNIIKMPKLAFVVVLFLSGFALANQCDSRHSLNKFGYKIYCEGDDFKVEKIMMDFGLGFKAW